MNENTTPARSSSPPPEGALASLEAARREARWKSRYMPIEHAYVIEDEAGNEIARIKAQPGTDRDKNAARLIAAAPELASALRLLLGDGETPALSSEEKEAIARQALKSCD